VFCQRCGAAMPAPVALESPTPSAVMRAMGPFDEMLARLQAATRGEFEIVRELGRGRFCTRTPAAT
jgi:hypothetical protein